jgi:hypothetical protein
VYDSDSEIPETPRGAGFETQDGFRKRAPIDSTISVHADYGLTLGSRRLVLVADAFNLFDQQAVLEYDDYTESPGFAVPNVDFGKALVYQAPFQLRVGVRFEF